MNWFGDPWPRDEGRAPVCEDDALRVPVPEGERCTMCREPVTADDRGVVLPHMAADRSVTQGFVHLGCLLGNVGVGWQ